MRIYSLKVRDDAKKDPGCAVVELSGLELIALNNILCKMAREGGGSSELLVNMACTMHTANAVVQHGGFDKIDLSAMERLYAQCSDRNRNGLEGETSEKFAGD